MHWLTDNGSIFAAYRILEIAAALNLEPWFTPVESPESNGMAEAFVKTFKRVNPIPDARTALLAPTRVHLHRGEQAHGLPMGCRPRRSALSKTRFGALQRRLQLRPWSFPTKAG